MRFLPRRVATICVVIAVAAPILAALTRPSRGWAIVLYSMAVTLVAASAVAGVATSGRTRAGWLGMAACAATYLAFAYDDQTGRPPFITRPIIERLADVAPLGVQTYATPGAVRKSATELAAVEDYQDKTNDSPGILNIRTYRQIAHALLAMALGCFGRSVALRIHDRSKSPHPP
jgi:hypothetical protein